MLSAETSASFRTGRDGCRATARQNKSVRGRSSASGSTSPTTIAVIIIIIVVAVTFAVGMAQLRPPFAAPTHQDGGKDIADDVTCTVTFRHPGYPDEHNIIMVLPALDDAQGGLHHETALIACAVVAGNRWDGFLSEQRTGSGVLTPRDGVLRGKEYYFRLPGDAKGRSTQQRLCSTQQTQTQSDSKVSTRPYFRTLALSARQAAACLVAIQIT
jgi:hypothetical protein